jgi:phosphomannomutase
MDLRDGVKVQFDDRWFLVRGSNTEPIIRVVAEAPTEEAARQLADEVFALVAATVSA